MESGEIPSTSNYDTYMSIISYQQAKEAEERQTAQNNAKAAAEAIKVKLLAQKEAMKLQRKLYNPTANSEVRVLFGIKPIVLYIN
jgi:hypothetical protein